MVTGALASPWLIAERRPERPALILADTGASVSFGEMVAAANRLANLFVEMGLQEGDCVAFFLENHIRYLELAWAAKIAGLYYVCMPRQLSRSDAAYILENSQAKVLITSAAQGPTAVHLLTTAGTQVRFFMMDGATEGFEDYERATAAQSDRPVEGRRRGASMLYSSGTTGRPKGVRHALGDASPHEPPPRHRMLKDSYGFDGETVFLNPGPFYHTAPLRFMMHAQREGATAIGFRKFDAEGVLRAVQTHRATHGFFVPTMFVRMLSLPDEISRAVDVQSMRVAIHGAAPISVAVKRRMIDWWGPVLHEIYGGTEAIGTTTINSKDWLAHVGSVGRATGGTEILVVDERGRPCPPGVSGLIHMRSGKTFEYFGEPEKTAACRLGDGWATFGDIGHLDAEGYLYLTDRQSNLIITGGVNVYPQEAENVLIEHPMVGDVAVIGVPHPEFGEEVKAVVVPAIALGPGDERRLEEALITHCRDRIGAIKSPRSVDFVDALPRSEAGKVVKSRLRERYWPEHAGLVA